MPSNLFTSLDLIVALHSFTINIEIYIFADLCERIIICYLGTTDEHFEHFRRKISWYSG